MMLTPMLLRHRAGPATARLQAIIILFVRKLMLFYYLNLSAGRERMGEGQVGWYGEERGGMGRFGSLLFSCHAAFVSVNAPSL